MNILDYIDWRGDISFSEKGLNEVDNLIFSTLAYLRMEGLVSADGADAPDIAALCRAYLAAGYDQSYMANDPLPLLRKAADSERFRNVAVRWYVNEIDADKQIQFSAVTFLYAEDQAYIAIRGTDNTLVGWREDCNMSFLNETPGQYAATAYVNRVASLTNCRLTVGGHSKGGNFAVYAAAFCEPAVRHQRIDRVFSNDGPGFKNEVTSDENYLAILPKTEKIIPDSSLVGILLSGKERRKVIKSSAKGVMQHNPYTWCVLGAAFEAADERTQSSIFMDDTLSKWVSTLSDENLRTMFNVIFDSLESSGATTLNEIQSNKLASYSAIFKAISKVDSESRSDILGSLQKLFGSGMDTVKESLEAAGDKHKISHP